MIERILDKYYTKKLELLLNRCKRWLIDIEIREYNQVIFICIKADDEEKYGCIMSFKKEEVFLHLCNQEELIKEFTNRVIKYLGGE